MNLKQFDLTPLANAGVFLRNVQDGHVQQEHDVFNPHRDKHYTLLIITSGRFRIMLDFNALDISEPAILLINPGQVHQVLEIDKASGWAIDFDASLVSETYQYVFEKGFTVPLLLSIETNLMQQILTVTNLLFQVQSETKHNFSHRIMHQLLSALLGLLAGDFSLAKSDQALRDTRGTQIEQAFNQLLKSKFRIWKRPAQYAEALSITVAHLNETVKEGSGCPVSIHIQQRSILEAKRLLYFTGLSVKEIAYEVGYNDPVYFSRLFKKTTILTPLQFREQFHD